MNKVRVSIDGQTVEVPEGSSALDAIHAAGLDVPTACSDPRLEPAGSCRLCLVRLKGTNRPVTACALPVREGMEIVVDDPELNEARRSEMTMLAKKYPAEYVEQFPEKTFHKWLTAYGLQPGGKSVSERIDDSNPYFRFDPEACIKCFRCVRICDEVQGSFVWQVFDRGTETHVAPDAPSLIESTCKSCGACVDACPTGALVDKTRLADGLPDKWTRTTCPYCGVGCELNVGTKNNHIVQVLPVKDAPVNKGHLCVKGRYAHQFVHSNERLTDPLIRQEDGSFKTVTWAEAIEYVAQEFKRILAANGPDSIGVLGSARAPNEDNYLAQKFARTVIGTNNVDCCARVCHGPTAAAMKVMLGTGAATNSYNDLELAETILVVGSNPLENHPIVGDRIRQAVLHGAKLIVLDPRAIELTQIATVHIPLKPGTNVPVLHAMAHVMFEEGLVDEGYLATRVDEVETFREFVKGWTPERAAELAGIDPELIRKAARLYATSKPSMAFHGLGVTEHLQGTEGVMCLVNLALITGNMGKPGSGINPLRGQNNVQGSAHMGCEPSNLTGFVSIPDGKAKFESVWKQSIPTGVGLRLPQMLDAAIEGKFKALWAIGYDIYFSNASAALTREQLLATEFVIVQDIFMTATAEEFAHVVLPACTSFERGGTFMNAERRVQRVRAAVDPVGNSKPDWEIIQMVAHAMGHGEGFNFTSEEDIWEEVRLVWAPGAGMSYKRLEVQGLQWPCPTEDHPGTTILHKESFPLGPKAPLQAIEFTPTPEITTPEFPFLLNSGRTLYQFNAGTMTARTFNQKLRPTDTLDMHPRDAREKGFTDGEQVRVTSAYGHAQLPIRVTREVRPGELFATFHEPKVFLNLITSPVRDKKVGTPEYKVTAVRVEKL